MISIKDGQFYSFKVEKGKYILEMTSSNDNAIVEWVGCSCQSSSETTQVIQFCELYNNGQLIVKNPSQFGTGPTIIITIKLTKTSKDGLY